MAFKRYLQLALLLVVVGVSPAFAQTDTPTATNTPTNTPTPTQTIPAVADESEFFTKAYHYGQITYDPANQGSAAKFCADVLIPGVEKGDLVILYPPSALEATLLYVGTRITANNKVSLCLYATGSVNGAARQWEFLWLNTTVRDQRGLSTPTPIFTP